MPAYPSLFDFLLPLSSKRTGIMDFQQTQSASVNLCSFCKAIDFDFLRAPTAGQLRLLSAGQNVTGQYPFKRQPEGSPTEWCLGTMKRIQQSSESCVLCEALLQLYHEIQAVEGPLSMDNVCNAVCNHRSKFRPREINNISLALLEDFGLKQPQDLLYTHRSMTIFWDNPIVKSDTAFGKRAYANYWLSACDAQDSPPLMLFQDDSLPDSGLLLSRRPVEPRVQPKMLHAWMGECLSKHETTCGIASASR